MRYIKEAPIGIAKLVGRVWIFVALPFRAYARNYVYNCVLQGVVKWRIKRLDEREYTDNGDYWMAFNVHDGHDVYGHIKRRKVNKIMFYIIVFLIWGWLDDDANQDTSDEGFCETITSGKRKINPYTPTDIIVRLWSPTLKDIDWSKVRYGNSFDLGDIRALNPFFHFIATMAWNNRNTAMNFQYLFNNY